MTTPIASTATSTATPQLDQLKKVAGQFEAVFLRQMIGSMRSASLGDGVFDTSSSQQFRDMGDAKLAEQMADKGALHIADLLVGQFGARLGGAAAKAATVTAAAGETTK